MKRSRLVFPTILAASAVSLVSLGTGAAAQPGGPSPASTASPSATSKPVQAKLKHAPVAIPAGRWAPGSPQAAALRGHRPNPPRPTVEHLAPRLNRLAGLPGAPDTGSSVRLERDGRVEVTVTGPAAAAAARSVGARVLASYAGASTVLLPPARLRELARHSGVSLVAPAVRPMPQSTSEGVAASGAQSWATNGNVGNGGAGVKIGIVDVGFAGLQAEIAAGNFDDPDGNPVNVVYAGTPSQNQCADDTLTPHGTAVSEIVHQMAPRATLYLFCIDDNVGFASAASQAVAAGIKIVNSSLAFTAETRGDGYGPASSSERAVRTAREAGVLWIQSSGNGAQDHWSGSLVDSNSDSFVDLQSAASQADEVALDPGYAGNMVLNWDQWPSSSLEVSLAISMYNDSNVQLGQTRYLDHAPGDAPVLELDISNLPGDPYYTGGAGGVRYFDVVVLIGAHTPAVHYNLYYGGDVSSSYLSYDDPARAAVGSVLEPASSPWALAVGAAFRGDNSLEPFSSRGPTIDGRVKPDLLGYDGVSSNIAAEESSQYDDQGNVIPGTTGFYGTSAAAPHVAGAAALIAAANPAMDASDIEAFLQRRANPQGNPPTNAAGNGLLQLGAPTGIAAEAGSQYFPFATPNRIADTRSGLGVRAGLLGAGTAVAVPVASTGTNAVPAGATAVVISLSGTGAQGGTYLSVYSKVFGGNSTLNLNSKDANATVTAIVKLNSSHGFLLRNAAAPTHALVTLLGYFGAPAATGGLGYVALPSHRLLDTRVPTGISKVAKLTPNQAVTVDAAPGGVPADATVAVVNMTALNQTAGGYLTAYPSASPAVASVDYRQYSRSNLVAVPLVNRKFVVQNRFASTDAMIDIVGYFSPSATARFVTLPNPRRIADTRTGNGGHNGTMTANAAFTLDAGGLYGVPYSVSGLWIGLTAIAAGNGYLSIYPKGTAAPHASNLDFTTGRVVPNAAIATLSAGTSSAPPGFSTVNRFGSSQVLEDAYGYFVTPGP